MSSFLLLGKMVERKRILDLIEARAKRAEQNVALPTEVRVMIAAVLRNMIKEIADGSHQ